MASSTLILGAGVCGLAAAWRLLERDPSRDVVLLEKEERPGGLARGLTVGGQLTDLGPHRLFTELPDVQEFLQDLAGNELTSVTRKSRMWLRKGWIEYPPKPLEIAAHLGVQTLALAGASYALNKAAALVGLGAGGRESFESLMVAGFGPDLYRLLVGPYAEKVWKITPREIHADIARVRVSAGGLDQMVKKLFLPEEPGKITAVKKFFYLPGGVESLVHKMREGIEKRGGKIRNVRRVADIEPKGKSWRVMAENATTGGVETYDAGDVVSTIPVGDLLSPLLDRKPNRGIAKSRGELRYISNFLVCVVVNKPRVVEDQWLYFPERDTIFNRAYEPRNFHSSMATGGRSMMVFEITCHPGDRIDRASDARLTAATLRGAQRVGLINPTDVAETFVHRIPQTYPLYDLDYRKRLSNVWRYLESFPTLISAGRQGLFLHNNMDHSIHMGFRAADRFLEGSENPAAEFYSEVRKFQQFRIVD